MAFVFSAEDVRRIAGAVRAFEGRLWGKAYRTKQQAPAGNTLPRLAIAEFREYAGGVIRAYLRKPDGTRTKDGNGNDLVIDVQATTDPPGKAINECKPYFSAGQPFSIAVYRESQQTRYMLHVPLLFAEVCECP